MLCTLIACALVVSPNIPDADLWGHVQYGRDALKHGVEETATYTYTAEGYLWINHENLSEVMLAVAADTIGPIGLMIGKCLLIMGVIGLVMASAKRDCARSDGASLMVVCGTALLVALNLTYFSAARPHLFSMVLFALEIALLNWCFAGWRDHWHLPVLKRVFRAGEQEPLTPGPSPTRGEGSNELPARGNSLQYHSARLRWLWAGLPLLLIWTNAHGAFLAGLAVWCAYLGCRAIEAFCVRGRKSFGLLRRMALMIAGGIAVTLINPYGPRLLLWLKMDLEVPRPEIMEWAPIAMSSPVFWPFVALAGVTLISLLASRKPLDFTQLVVMGAVLSQAASNHRHIMFLTVLCGFWIPIHIEDALRRLREKRAAVGPVRDASGNMVTPKSTSKFGLGLIGTGLIAACIALSVQLAIRLSDFPVRKNVYPVSAFQFMEDHRLHGKLVVHFNWAQYAIMAFCQEELGDRRSSVQCDGRLRTCYPQEVTDMHFDFIQGDTGPGTRWRSPNMPEQIDGTLLLEFGKPDLVLVDRSFKNSVRVMQGVRDHWTLLYQDEIAQLWGRASKYDDPASDDYFPAGLRNIGETKQIGSVTWPALPVRQGSGEVQVANQTK